MILDDAADLPLTRPSRDGVREGDFAARVEESGTLAFRVAYGVLRRAEDAEEVAQEAFLKAHRSFAALRERDGFRAWLVRMTFRLALDRRRGDQRRLRRDGVALSRADGGESESESAEDSLERRERARHVHAAVDGLPRRLRLVVLLAAIEEHDLGEVARLLELPVGTVKSRLHRARALLAERLRWLVDEDGTR